MANIFKNEEEDRKNLKHLRQRKKIMLYVDKLREVYFLTFYTFKKSNINHASSHNERTLSYSKDETN